MEVKKFEAFSMQDAIKLVRKEFGKDAVILATREKQGSGEMAASKVIEVVAARGMTSASVLSPAEAKDARPFDFRRVKTREEATVVKNGPNLGRFNNDTMRAAQLLSQALTEPKTQRSNAAQASPVHQQRQHDRLTDFDVEKLPSNEISELREELTRVRREIEVMPQIDVNEQVQEIKVLLHEIMRENSRRDKSVFHDYITDIGVKLRAAGVLESIVSNLLPLLAGIEVPKTQDGQPYQGEKLREFYLNQAVRIIFKQIQVTGAFRNENGNQQMLCLVGPTGVGKTTTIAKLAAKLKLQDKKKVVLVSMDSYRIAAADQLRVYGKILDCPFAEASDGEELTEIVQRHSDADFILVDTAGRSFRAMTQMDNLRKLQQVQLPLHFHLVLSSTMKQRDMEENIKAFRFLSLESLLFTKLDESWSFGEILNCVIRGKIPLSYFTTGQKVPEDLEVATKERVVERLFRL